MNVTGQLEVGHPEYAPDISSPLFVLATCPVESRPEGAPRLWGNLKIKVLPGSMAHRIYGQIEIEEPYTSNFELNPDYREILEKSGVKISGVNEDGAAGIVEFPDRPFYITTGFTPQLSSGENNPHPLITAYLKAAGEYHREEKP